MDKAQKIQLSSLYGQTMQYDPEFAYERGFGPRPKDATTLGACRGWNTMLGPLAVFYSFSEVDRQWPK